MALAPCPNCEKKISREAEECPKCGHPLTEELWELQEKSENRNAIIIFIVGFLVIGFLILMGSLSGEPDAVEKLKNAESRCNDEVEAFGYSKQFVRRRLGSASSADIAYLVDPGTQVIPLGNCRHQVIGYADAEYSFGAKVRTWYTTIMSFDKSQDNWVNLTASMQFASSSREINAIASLLRDQYVQKQRNPSSKSSAKSQVLAIQKKLNSLGYGAGKEDGIMGPKTRNAIENFQRSNDLAVEGIVSPPLLQALGIPVP